MYDISNIMRSAGEVVCDMIGMVTGLCEEVGAGDIDAGSTERTGTEEILSLVFRDRKEAVN